MLLPRPLNWLLRFRHRRGYGIHSPFAFNLVTDVVYNCAAYYAYRPLAAHYHVHRKELSPLRLKDCKLLFRLSNYQHPREVLLMGYPTNHPLAHYLALGSRQAHFTALDFSKKDKTPPAPQLLLASPTWPQVAQSLLEHLPPGALLIVQQVGGRNKAAWNDICRHPNAQVTFDLRDWGLIFNLPQLQRAHYLINYY